MRGTSPLWILNSSAVVNENNGRQEETGKEEKGILVSFQGQREWILASFHSNHRLRCYSGRQWQADTQLHWLPTHIAQKALSSSVSLPLSFIIFSLYCISTGPHSSTTPSFPPAEILSSPSFLTSPICLSILPSVSPLTRSSDCAGLHLHSSGGSWSCSYACPGSCYGCCAPYSHWAPCRTGMAVRIRWASGTVVGVSGKETTQRRWQRSAC